jgi:hypothetical protein
MLEKMVIKKLAKKTESKNETREINKSKKKN